jgi:hypothetical protein
MRCVYIRVISNKKVKRKLIKTRENTQAKYNYYPLAIQTKSFLSAKHKMELVYSATTTMQQQKVCTRCTPGISVRRAVSSDYGGTEGSVNNLVF